MKNILFDDLGRKFLYAVGFGLAGYVLVLFRLATPDSWFTFIEWLAGLFIAGNVADKATKILQKD